MLKSIEGTYRDGQIELHELPREIVRPTRVIVTFIDADEIDLGSRGLTQEQINELRFQLATFAEGWNAPEMSDYDNYQPPFHEA